MSSRRQQNRGFKPSPSGTTHAKVNATGYVPSKRFRKYHALARGRKFFDAERTPLRLHSERMERSRHSSVALHTCRNKNDSGVIVFMDRLDQNQELGTKLFARR